MEIVGLDNVQTEENGDKIRLVIDIPSKLYSVTMDRLGLGDIMMKPLDLQPIKEEVVKVKSEESACGVLKVKKQHVAQDSEVEITKCENRYNPSEVVDISDSEEEKESEESYEPPRRDVVYSDTDRDSSSSSDEDCNNKSITKGGLFLIDRKGEYLDKENVPSDRRQLDIEHSETKKATSSKTTIESPLHLTRTLSEHRAQSKMNISELTRSSKSILTPQLNLTNRLSEKQIWSPFQNKQIKAENSDCQQPPESKILKKITAEGQNCALSFQKKELICKIEQSDIKSHENNQKTESQTLIETKFPFNSENLFQKDTRSPRRESSICNFTNHSPRYFKGQPQTEYQTPKKSNFVFKSICFESPSSSPHPKNNSYHHSPLRLESRLTDIIPLNNGEQITKHIKVFSSSIGIIVGRGGRTIEQLEMDSGCSLKVENVDGSHNEGRISIQGSQEGVEKASLLLQKYTLPGDVIETMDIPSNCVGLIIGFRGRTIQRIRSDTGTVIEFGRAHFSTTASDSRPCHIAGIQQQVFKAIERITHIIARKKMCQTSRFDRLSNLGNTNFSPLAGKKRSAGNFSELSETDQPQHKRKRI